MPIYETPRGWKIRNVKGYHPNKEAAQKRLAAIKASQAEQTKPSKQRGNNGRDKHRSRTS
jgi:hypothetical protein